MRTLGDGGRTPLILLLAGLGFAATSGVAYGDNASAEPRKCFDGRPVEAREHERRLVARDCTLTGVVIRDGLAGAVVPPVGVQVRVNALGPHGDQELVVYRESKNSITLGSVGDETRSSTHEPPTSPVLTAPVESDVDAASPMSPYSTFDDSQGCRAIGYGLKGWSHYTFGWYYNSSGTTGMTVSEGLEEVRQGVDNLTSRRNNCGGVNNGNLSNTYAGTTSTAPGFTSAGECASNDEKNVIGWKTVSAGYLQATCTYSQLSGSITTWKNSDIVINTKYGWTAGIKATCSIDGLLSDPRYDVQGIITHETGHVFGLADKYESSHRHLTMYGYGSTCTDNQRTLGWGDLDGLRFMYP